MRVIGVAWAILGLVSLQGSTAAIIPVSSSSDSSKRAPSSHVVHETLEKRHVESWTRIERADATANLPMRIGLKQSNLDQGHQLLMDM